MAQEIKTVSKNHPLLDGDVILAFANGVAETLNQVVSMTSHFEKPFVTRNWQSEAKLSMTMSLNLLVYQGKIQIHFSEEVLKDIVHKFTGLEHAMNSSEMLNGMCHLSKKIYNSILHKLENDQAKLNILEPTTCWTKQLPHTWTQTTCLVIPFRVEDQLCHVELVI